MVAAVIEGDVEVEDVAIEEDARVGDAVADYFVGGGADGFGEGVIVEGGGVGLWSSQSRCRGRQIGQGLTFRSMQALWQTSSR